MTVFSSVITPDQKFKTMSSTKKLSEMELKVSQPGLMESSKKATATGSKVTFIARMKSITTSQMILGRKWIGRTSPNNLGSANFKVHLPKFTARVNHPVTVVLLSLLFLSYFPLTAEQPHREPIVPHVEQAPSDPLPSIQSRGLASAF